VTVATKIRHTRGPWKVTTTGERGDRYHHVYVDGPGGLVAVVEACGNPRKALGDPELSDMPEPEGGPIQMADAALIALAPEMEEAIEDVAEFIRNGTPIHPGSDVAQAVLSLAKLLGGRS
jgi:hypothetical protein